MELRKFSPKTIKAYFHCITDLLEYSNKNPKTVDTNHIRNYLESLTDKGRIVIKLPSRKEIPPQIRRILEKLSSDWIIDVDPIQIA